MLLSCAATEITLSTSDFLGVSKTPQTQSPLILISLHISHEFIIATHSDKNALYIFASVGLLLPSVNLDESTISIKIAVTLT